ncbi:MAG: hypothetical protein ACTSRS_00935 [Candidatus Helarchaeota archaeon]
MACEIWTEKYRPKTLSNLIGLKSEIHELNAFIKKRNIPHLILVGPPGRE